MLYRINRHGRLPRRKQGCASLKESGGFTLVEMMVAIVIIGVALAAAFSTVAHAFRTVESGRDYTRVAQIMQSNLEDMRTNEWSDLEALQAIHGAASWDLPLGDEFVALFGDRYTVSCQILNRVTDQKEIIVRVRWEDPNGVIMNKMTSAWFTRLGMHDYYYRTF